MARIEQISSLANPKVKSIAALAQKKERIETGLFVVEGLQLVGFGVEAGWELVTLVVGQETKEPKNHGTEVFLSKLYAAAGLILEVTPAVLEKLVRKENPQGVVGVFRQRTTPLTDIKVGKDVWVVLEGIRDPGNLGTIIRTVDAVGAKGVILAGTCTDLWAPEVLRATMGSIFHVPVVHIGVERLLAWKEGARLTMVGTHLRGTTDYREVAKLRGQNGYGQGLLVAMGTEQSGLSEELTHACDILTKISMRGGAESLNLSIATAVMLYEIFRDAA